MDVDGKEDRSRPADGASGGAGPAGRVASAPGAAPLPPARRLGSLDVLRGLALLGILAVNIQIFSGSPAISFNVPLRVAAHAGAYPVADYLVMLAQWAIFEGKMRALFSLLFGAGCMLILERLTRNYGPGAAARIFYRRLAWLMVFGLLHGVLIWSGDVLFLYAAVAMVSLYPLRNLAGARLVPLGLAVALVGGTIGISNALDLPAAWTAARLEEGALDAIARGARPEAEQLRALEEARARRRAQVEALASPEPPRPSLLQGVRGNAAGYRGFVSMILASGWVLETLGLFIAGMGLLKCGFLTAQLPSRRYLKIAIAGYSVSLPIVAAGFLHAGAYEFSGSVTSLWTMLPYEFQVIPGALGHAAMIMLIVRNGYFPGVQNALAAVGRMAFTNYVLTSILCQSLFAWFGILPVGGLEHYALMLVTVAIWAVILASSRAWLRAFAFGSLEWAWRSLTYGRAQALAPRRQPS